MNTDELTKVINFWRGIAIEGPFFPRDLTQKIDLSTPEVVDLTGVRRAGKSFILKLLIQKTDDWFYMNFEDPFFLNNNEPQIIESMLEIHTAIFGAKPKYIFLDEVQNIKNWETVVRKFRDARGYKIFVTGSSAKLLSRELSTLLSGRHLSHEVFPLSFGEYLKFKGISVENKKDVIVKEAELLANFSDYLKIGGFPEVITTQKLELLKQYYGDILERDIIKRHEIRDVAALQKMGAYLISSSGKTVSLATLQDLYKLNYETVIAYLSYFKDSFLLFELPQFSYSLRTTQKALKKIYCIDTGLANSVSFKFSHDYGRMLENAVFLHLRRNNDEIYYFRGNNDIEVDFVVKDRENIEELIQVTWDISDKKTLDREIRGLKEANKELRCENLTILTQETSGEKTVAGLKIQIKPVWRWMLEEN